MKWSFVPKNIQKPRYIVCNADESEPGTCKDRLLMQFDPHAIFEGMMIAGLSIGAHKGYIYIRGEYRFLIEIVERAIDEAYERGWLGKNIQGSGFDFDIVAHSGAGAYECGEESALLESLGFPDRGIAVAMDFAVLPRSAWATKLSELSEPVRLEVVTAVQGG